MPRQLVRDAVQLPCFSVDAAQGRVHFGDRHAAAAELYFELRAGPTKAPEEDFRLELVAEKRLAAISDVVAQGDPCDLCDLSSTPATGGALPATCGEVALTACVHYV